MRRIAIFIITLYQKTLSPDHGWPKKWGLVKNSVCVFYPTCSEYTKQAILKYGAIRGCALGLKRISRCHPWQREHLDEVL